ncbi:DNA adenine methylase [Vibrio sp. D431a]|uniref:DNA adenine methylase n=1 Tax=Vibrio sp. D431a TaxID=2837388 RepID=UPI002554E147|nr:DNA adenine methylase [Vibrio sp. D431a]MDK9793280.1 DNA adenine methylase [Vibrio sp. D431a]
MKAPHFLPYQGSKRKVADQIIQHIPKSAQYNTLYEPFAGSAAFSLFALTTRPDSFNRIVLGESYTPLAEIWRMVIECPNSLVEQYEKLWCQQSDCKKENNDFYLKVREEFNVTLDPSSLLFLAARCVKNSIRFNSMGEFNQSADKRRKGVKPNTMAKNVFEVHELIKGRSEMLNADFMDIFNKATADDIVYCDPPWLGITNTTNKRYYQQLDLDRFVNGLELLNSKSVDFLVSFDGMRGEKDYGGDLPSYLNLKKVYIDGGVSSQSVLNGMKERTLESLYISESLCHKLN